MQAEKFFHSHVIGDGLAIIAGALLTLAFAPFGIFPFAVLSPALLLALWLKVSPKRAFLRGWLYGMGLFGSGIYWIYISVHTFGNIAPPIALLITGTMIAILALFPAYNGYLLNRFFPKQNLSRMLCAFPATWVLMEWIRSWLFSGFPWLLLGYSQINSPLKGYAPLLSVYGVSLAAALSAGLLVNIVLRFRRAQYKALYFSLLAFATLWILGSLLSMITWTKPNGPQYKVSLIQGNIPQALKWSPEEIFPTLKQYHDLTDAHWDSQIIIWPESAIPVPLQDAGSFLDKMSELAKQHHVALLMGIPVESEKQRGSYFNTVISLGNASGVYAKQRLVPFGEYVPFTDLFQKFFDILHVPMSDFISGPRTSPIQVGNLKIATFICYEIAFPEQVLSRDGKIGLILTISNDAWFGHSIAQAQHLEMGQMRALEMGRPVVFVSNNGITAFIAPDGHIQSAAPPFETAVLTDSVRAFIGKTPWQLLGMDPILLILFTLLLVAIRFRRR